ncbi:MAG: hypothetical protein ACYTG4_07355 [Planctomycetota bacterium]|jgi:hypothetical protein
MRVVERSVLGVGLLGLLVVLAAVTAPTEARAREEYAEAEDRKCSACHVSERGGGPRNDQGELFLANGYTFVKEAWSGDDAKKAYGRALAAYRATHYKEVRRLLGEMRETETLPGGKMLLDRLETRLKLFAPAWLRAAKKNLRGLSRQRAVGIRYLLQVVTECGGTDEAKEAEKLLADLRKSKDTKLQAQLKDAEAAQKIRLRFLDARLLEGIGEKDGAKKEYLAIAKEHAAAPEAGFARERLALMERKVDRE